MRSQLSYLIFAAALGLGACGDTAASATIGSDSGVATCNPYTQQGCLPGEKCSSLLLSGDPGPVTRTTVCQPNGKVPIGGDCGSNRVGIPDDCHSEPGQPSRCSERICSLICQVGTDDCGEATCITFGALFDDLPVGIDLGVCRQACDPVGSPNVDDTDCPDDQGCFINPRRGTTYCNAYGESVQGDTCSTDGEGLCYLDGCASGYMPFLLDLAGRGLNQCGAFCRPENSYIGSAGSHRGALGADCSAERIGAAGNYQCRFLQTYYGDTSATAADIGICAPVDELTTEFFADCAVFDWLGMKETSARAEAEGKDPLLALRQMCSTDPTDLYSKLRPECFGIYRGCLSLAEQATLRFFY